MKSPLFAAALITLAAHAFAGPVEAPAAPEAVTSIGAAFVAPISRTIISAGAEQVGQLGSPSLSAISGMIADNPLALKKNADSLVPLGRALQGVLAERGQTIKEFNTLPTGERVELLKQAAALAKASAEADAKEALSRLTPETSAKDAAELAARLGALADSDGFYVKKETAARLAAAAKTAKDIAERPARERKAFFDSLGQKLVDGAFTAENTFEKTAAGWHFADYPSDEHVYPTLEQAVVARMQLAHKLPAGPWKQDVNGAILEALRRPELVAELKTTLSDAAIESMRASAASGYESSLADTPKLTKAMEAMRASLAAKTAPSHGTVLTLARAYNNAADNYRGGLIENWRVAAGMLEGRPEAGYPSIDELEKMRRQAKAAAHARGLKALIAMIASAVPMMAAGAAQAWLGTAASAVFAIAAAGMLASMLAMFFFMWRRDALGLLDAEMPSVKVAVDSFEELAFPNEGEHRRKRHYY